MRRWSPGRLLLALLLAAAASTAAPPCVSRAADDPIQQRQKELSDLRRQMDANRKKIEELRRKEKNLGDLDGRLRRDRTMTERYLAQLEAQERDLLANLSDRQTELALRTADCDDAARVLRRHLRTYQRARRPVAAELLVSSRSFGELLGRGAIVSRAIDRDRARLLELTREQLRLAEATGELMSRRETLAGLQEEKLQEKLRLERRSEQAKDEIAKLRRERGAFEKRQEELARSEKQIHSLIARLEEERRKGQTRGGGKAGPGGPGLEGRRGRLVWPVRGDVVGRFGTEVHPRFGTKVPSKGIDIAAPAGTPIASVAAGVAEFVDWLPGYGRCVIVHHGGGFYTLYAHCARVHVAKGAKITEGQRIAEVGDTDSIKGNCLHFEIRRGEEALDPMGWLQ